MGVKRGLSDSRKKLEIIMFKKRVLGKIFTPRKESDRRLGKSSLRGTLDL